jgi:hypothetical protein
MTGAVIRGKESSKNKPYFLTAQTAKKDRQSPPFFGGKSKRTPSPDGFCVVFTRFEGGLCLPSNPN